MARLPLTMAWMAALLLLPAALLAFLPVGRLGALAASLVLLVILTAFTLRFSGPSSIFLLAICIALGITHLVAIIIYTTVFTTAHAFLLLLGVVAVCGIAVHRFGLHLDLGRHHVQGWALGKVGIRALLFGFLFYVLREPFSFISKDPAIMVIFLLAIAVAEESLFRLVVFRTAENAFGYKTALWLQAAVYACAHLIFFTVILSYYGRTPTALSETPLLSVAIYLLALFWFGYRAGVLAGPHTHSLSGGNLAYAILLHWLVRLVMYVGYSW